MVHGYRFSVRVTASVPQWGQKRGNVQGATETRPHIPEVRAHGSKVTENVNLPVCTFVCVLVCSLGGFCGICVWEPEWICLCVSEMSIKFEMHLWLLKNLIQGVLIPVSKCRTFYKWHVLTKGSRSVRLAWLRYVGPTKYKPMLSLC